MYAQVFNNKFTLHNTTEEKKDELICFLVACELIHWICYLLVIFYSVFFHRRFVFVSVTDVIVVCTSERQTLHIAETYIKWNSTRTVVECRRVKHWMCSIIKYTVIRVFVLYYQIWIKLKLKKKTEEFAFISRNNLMSFI